MVMTHYMELLSLHSPWFLILFMAVPVVFIETIFMAEAFSLLGSGKEREKWQTLSHRGGLFFSLYFIVAALYLVTRYIPTIEWRAPSTLSRSGPMSLASSPPSCFFSRSSALLVTARTPRKMPNAISSSCCSLSFSPMLPWSLAWSIPVLAAMKFLLPCIKTCR